MASSSDMPARPLRLALIGHGRMGQLVERLAEAQGHTITAVCRSGAPAAPDVLAGSDVAIDFSHADAVPGTAAAAAEAGVPLVTGTTGWQAQQETVARSVAERGGLVVYGANFSIGVHVFYRVVQHAAGLFAKAGGYAPFLEEQHHAAKKDAPSGTALVLQRSVAEAFPDAALDVAATRAGHIPGTHRVGFDGVPDQVLLTHTARSRDGFAQGALVAAAWAVGAFAAGRRGLVPFEDVMADVLG